ncbi:MAG: tetratricopeptide repeat protein [Alphaproteobacteria bacterium]|nr:tetratricopeptide repeat protein [Alphaproteobacteria bacterium]
MTALLCTALALMVAAFLAAPFWRTNRKSALALAFGLMLGAGLFYLYLGAPDLPDKPYAARRNDPDFRLNTIAETMATELAERPDAEGYKRAAALFLAIGRFDRAAEASRKAVEHGADDAETWSRLGESLVRANDGMVVMDAQDAFKKALKRDPKDVRARFSMGLAQAQIGNFKKAVGIWRDLERDATPDAPWLPQVKKSIREFSRKGGFDPASIPPRAPEAGR